MWTTRLSTSSLCCLFPMDLSCSLSRPLKLQGLSGIKLHLGFSSHWAREGLRFTLSKMERRIWIYSGEVTQRAGMHALYVGFQMWSPSLHASKLSHPTKARMKICESRQRAPTCLMSVCSCEDPILVTLWVWNPWLLWIQQYLSFLRSSCLLPEIGSHPPYPLQSPSIPRFRFAGSAMNEAAGRKWGLSEWR